MSLIYILVLVLVCVSLDHVSHLCSSSCLSIFSEQSQLESSDDSDDDDITDSAHAQHDLMSKHEVRIKKLQTQIYTFLSTITYFHMIMTYYTYPVAPEFKKARVG